MFEEYTVEERKNRLRNRALALGVGFRDEIFDSLASRYGAWNIADQVDVILDRCQNLKGGESNAEKEAF